MNTPKFEKGNVLVIAHRGLSGIETENTNAAFVAAGNRSYYGIETDIHRTADGNLVIFQKKTLVRQKLDYLQDLGIEVIYFNPLFVSPSNHKYDSQAFSCPGKKRRPSFRQL